MSGITTLWSSSKGDINFPMTPQSIDNMTIGATTPAPGTFTSLTSMGLAMESVAGGIVAGSTHTLAGATPLGSQTNIVATVAVSGDGVALPAATAAIVGTAIVAFNQGASPAAVWPQAADKIDGGSAGAAVTLTNAKRCAYYCVAINTWVSAQLGVASA
jgi:hypothetical protein